MERKEKKMGDFTMKKPGKRHFTQVIKAIITSGKSCTYHIPADM